jgi:hypothetical protein
MKKEHQQVEKLSAVLNELVNIGTINANDRVRIEGYGEWTVGELLQEAAETILVSRNFNNG